MNYQSIFSKINKKTIEAYQKRLDKELELSPSTVKRRLSTLRKFCDWAEKENYLKENPFAVKPEARIKKPELRIKISPPSILHSSFSILNSLYATYQSISITTYLHYAILIIFCVGLGMGLYNQLTGPKAEEAGAYPTALTPPNRYLSFQGRLTDSSNNPIDAITNFVFKLYDDATVGSQLWSSGNCSIDPDADGIFSVLLGLDCGGAIDDTVFSENAGVWLEITVGTSPYDEILDPRIQVATVAYALNAETLQGYPPGTAASRIPYINSDGDVVIAAASPVIQATSGTFSIEGATGVTIQATDAGNGNVSFTPDGSGRVIATFEASTGNLLDVQGGANIGGVGGKEANTIIYGYAGTNSTNLNLLKLEAGSPVDAKFTVDASGNASAAGYLRANTTGSYFTGDITVSGGDITGTGDEKIDIGEATADTIQLFIDATSELTLSSTVLQPTSNAGLSLGGVSNQWNDLYVDGLVYIDGLGEDLDVGDFDITSIDKLEGYDAGLFIDMGQDSQIIISSDGAGTPFSSPDIDITGSVYFDDHIGLASGKQIQFADAGEYIVSDGTDLTIASGNDIILSSTGNVGIGMTGPGYLLEVAGVIGADEFRDRGTSYYLDLANPGISGLFAGDVGIGTDSPDNLLSLNEASGDVILDFDLADADKWVMGIDDSDGDYFKINSGNTLADASDFEFEDDGDFVMAGNLTVSGAGTHSFGGTIDPTNVTSFTLTGTETLGATYYLDNNGDAYFRYAGIGIAPSATYPLYVDANAYLTSTTYLGTTATYFDTSGNLTVSGNGTFTLGTSDRLYIDAATTDNTGTVGVIDLNVDAGDASVDGINIDFEALGGTASRTYVALQVTPVSSGGSSGFADNVYGINVANITGNAEDQEIGLRIGTGYDISLWLAGTAPNIRLGTAGAQFEFEDSDGNDLMTINDTGTDGNVAITGDLMVIGNDISGNVGGATGDYLSFTSNSTLASRSDVYVYLDTNTNEGTAVKFSIWNDATDEVFIVTGAGNVTANFGTATAYFVCKTVSGTGAAVMRDCSGSDYAEYFSAEANLEPGDLVSASPNITLGSSRPYKLSAARKDYDSKIIGIVSTDGLVANEQLEPTDQLIALAGKVPTKVSTINGPIEVGDLITSSSMPGVGMKATKAGAIVGKALEPFDSAQGGQGRIMVLVNLSWYDPEVYLTSTGDLQLNIRMNPNPSTGSGQANPNESEYSLVDAAGKIIERIGAFSEAVIANLRAGKIETEELISPLVETEQLTADSIKAKESQFGKLVSTRIDTDEIQINTDATVAGTLYAGKIVAKEIVGLKGKFGDLLAASVSAEKIQGLEERLAQLENTPSSTPSPEPTEPPATESGNPMDDVGLSPEIEALVNEILGTSLEATPQAELANVYGDNLNITNNLTVLGTTSLADTAIAGMLNVGGTMNLAENSINTLTGPLYLQNLGLGGIDILAGKIMIDEQGNAVFEGDVTIKGRLALSEIEPLPDYEEIVIDLTPTVGEEGQPETESRFGKLLVKGVDNEIIASIEASGTATFKKLAIAKAEEETIQISDTEIETNATAGQAVLPANEAEITIKSQFVTEKTMVYVTPISDTQNKVLFVKAKKVHSDEEMGWFKVAIDAPIGQDIKFNWWLIN